MAELARLIFKWKSIKINTDIIHENKRNNKK
jgi:hypothetical protein